MYIKLHSGLDMIISKEVYKSCIKMKEASMKLMELEASNHFQMMRLNIDWIIVEIDKMLPDISTTDDNKHIINCRYKFFLDKNGDKLLKNCRKIKESIELMPND